MKRILIIILAGVLLFLTGIVVLSGLAAATTGGQQVQPTPEPLAVREARTAHQVAELERSTQAADFWQIFWQVTAVTFLLIALIAVAVICWLLVTGALHRRSMQWANLNRLEPDPAGNYTAVLLPTGQLVQPAPGNLVQPVPSHYHNSSHFAPHLLFKPNAATAALQEPFPALPGNINQPATVPGFLDLLANGHISKAPGGNRLLLGYADGQPLYGSWLDLYSSAIAGMTGSGKTTTVRFLAAQAALQGARFVIVDPHALAGEESLASTLDPLAASSFLCRPAVEGDEIQAALFLAAQELERRIKGRTAERWPLIIAIDEFTSLMRTEAGKPLSVLLQDIAQQGRKVGVFALCMGQIWKGSTSGGTELRDSFASSYVHRLRRNQARLLLPAEEARQAESLPAGSAFFYRTSGDLVPVQIPLTTGDDIEHVAGLLVSQSSAKSRPEVSQPSATIEANRPDPADLRVLELFRQGSDVPAIVKEIYGVATSAGARYQQAARQVQEALRRVIT